MAQEEIRALLEAGVVTTLRLLRANRRFYPFALAVNRSGKTFFVNGDRLIPGTQAAVALLYKGLKQREDLQAVAVVSEVQLKDPETQFMSDAIRVRVEDASGTALTCYVPFDAAGSDVKAGEPTEVPGERVVFA